MCGIDFSFRIRPFVNFSCIHTDRRMLIFRRSRDWIWLAILHHRGVPILLRTCWPLLKRDGCTFAIVLAHVRLWHPLRSRHERVYYDTSVTSQRIIRVSMRRSKTLYSSRASSHERINAVSSQTLASSSMMVLMAIVLSVSEMRVPSGSLVVSW